LDDIRDRRTDEPEPPPENNKKIQTIENFTDKATTIPAYTVCDPNGQRDNCIYASFTIGLPPTFVQTFNDFKTSKNNLVENIDELFEIGSRYTDSSTADTLELPNIEYKQAFQHHVAAVFSQLIQKHKDMIAAVLLCVGSLYPQEGSGDGGGGGDAFVPCNTVKLTNPFSVESLTEACGIKGKVEHVINLPILASDGSSCYPLWVQVVSRIERFEVDANKLLEQQRKRAVTTEGDAAPDANGDKDSCDDLVCVFLETLQDGELAKTVSDFKAGLTNDFEAWRKEALEAPATETPQEEEEKKGGTEATPLAEQATETPQKEEEKKEETEATPPSEKIKAELTNLVHDQLISEYIIKLTQTAEEIKNTQKDGALVIAGRANYLSKEVKTGTSESTRDLKQVIMDSIFKAKPQGIDAYVTGQLEGQVQTLKDAIAAMNACQVKMASLKTIINILTNQSR
tara:strand:+ start:122 stop:1489 length:1368 start_codon:yes stop_codon:yes gene_type:complete